MRVMKSTSEVHSQSGYSCYYLLSTYYVPDLLHNNNIEQLLFNSYYAPNALLSLLVYDPSNNSEDTYDLIHQIRKLRH